MSILHYEFMQNALMAALLVGIACGVIGTYVVIKRIVFISGGISHASLGGIGLGYYLGVNPIYAAIPFSLFAALCIGIITKKVKASEDTAIGILWTVGMSLGIVFIDLSPGYAPELMSYLFGNILTVPRNELLIMLVLDIVIVGVSLALRRELLAISFDEEYASVVGMRTHLVYFTLLSLIALTVVVLIKAVGVILIIALLTIPAAVCKNFTFNIQKLIGLSIITSILSTISGLVISYYFNLPSGATIVLFLGFVFIVSSLIKKTGFKTYSN